MSRTHKIVDHDTIPRARCEKTGIYVGPGGDHRFYKAGDQIARTYRFDRPQGAPLSPEAQKQRDQQVAAYRKQRAQRLDEARLLAAAK
jgi:hypothetical protein